MLFAYFLVFVYVCVLSPTHSLQWNFFGYNDDQSAQDPTEVPDVRTDDAVLNEQQNKRRHGHEPKRRKLADTSTGTEEQPFQDDIVDTETENGETINTDYAYEDNRYVYNEDYTGTTNTGESDADQTKEETDKYESSKDKSIERRRKHPTSKDEANEEVDKYESIENKTTEKYETSTATTSCPNCIKKEKEKEARLEMVKDHLLGKLGLTSVPQVDGPLPPLPFDFYMGEDFTVSDSQDEIDEELEENHRPFTREIFVFGKDITETCYQRKGTGCYSFNISKAVIDPDLVASIELWVYKQVDRNDHHIQTFMVSELEPVLKNGKSMLRFRNIVKRMETRLKSGWMKIYVTRSVLRWLTKPHRNNGLAVVCKTCQRQNHRTIYGDKEGLGPLLVFYMKKQRPRRRVKRTTDCIEGGDNCCHREAMEINFHDIGWDYIMAPTRIRPNFCTGSCNGPMAAHYNHTRLVQTLQQHVQHEYSQIQTCCSPVAFSRPQSLLYRDHASVVRKIDIPDLIVGECGCT